MISRRVGKKHLCLSVKGALKQVPNNSKYSFANHDDGRPMTNKELRVYLAKADFEGKLVLPMGECDNFDDQYGCRGHDITLLVHDYEFEEGNG